MHGDEAKTEEFARTINHMMHVEPGLITRSSGCDNRPAHSLGTEERQTEGTPPAVPARTIKPQMHVETRRL